MKNALLVLAFAFPLILSAQSRDTSYLQEIGDKLFIVKERTNQDGSASMTRDVATDTVMVFNYWAKKMETIGQSHARSMAQSINATPLVRQAEGLKPLGKDPFLMLTGLVCEKLVGDWFYNGAPAQIVGTTLSLRSKGNQTYRIKAMCMQWIALEDVTSNNNIVHLYLTGDKYISLCGDELVPKKK